MQKMGLISARPVELIGRAELTWRAGPARMDVAHNATWQSHASPREEPRWPEWTRTSGRGHASPRGRPRGAMWRVRGWRVKGPRVSGAWL